MENSVADEQSSQSPTKQEQTVSQTAEDPLVAALPPNTDYITYLTLLDYNLTPKNLPTLNRLLGEDDGTLAAEIGWDLLKLVLPMLRVEPTAAQECLDLIARRGNPREVIVRVSEEFERLGRHETEDEAEGDDGLPTFAGEAPRVHLGDMKLAGMPETKSAEKTDANENDRDDGHVPGMADDEVVFVALTTMLSLLHPRIKTKYPSRFLATSLPAALGAYRRLSMNSATTEAILTTLTKLGSKQRPALPPRVSTSEVLRTSAPLPDPEARKEADDTSQLTVDQEAAIIQKLLQAVLLEVFDEKTTASNEGQPPLTARLRAQHEPATLISTRRQELEALESNPQVTQFDDLQLKFFKLAQTLKLDLAAEVVKIGAASEEPDEDEEVSEYPTSPKQIPLSETALILLYCVPHYSTGGATYKSVDPTRLLQALNHVWREDESTHNFKIRNSAPAVDSILALLYITFCVDLETKFAGDAEGLLLDTMKYFRSLFTTCPDPDLRDNAHHISTRIFHAYLSRTSRLAIIRDFTQVSMSEASPFYDGIAGSIRAVAVDWLRDELWPTQTVQKMCARQMEDERYLPLSCLGELSGQLFRTTLVDHDPPANVEDASADGFVSNVPYFISLLNLLALVAGDTHREDTGLDLALANGEALLRRLAVWKDWCVAMLAKPRDDALEVGRLALPDIFALEDAVARARDAMQLEE